MLVSFLPLLVQYILAPTLTVSWQGIEEGDLLGGGGGGCWVPVAVVVGGFSAAGGLLLWCRRRLFVGCLSCNRERCDSVIPLGDALYTQCLS